MIGFVFATRTEARPFLARIKAVEIPAEPFTWYRSKPEAEPKSELKLETELVIVTCGLGKVKAALATQLLIHQHHPQIIINAGICGALADGQGFQPGCVFRIAQATEAPPGPRPPW